MPGSHKPPELRLPYHAHERLAAVSAGAGVSERAARHHTGAAGVGELAIGQQSRIESDYGVAKLERQSAIESAPENAIG